MAMGQGFLVSAKLLYVTLPKKIKQNQRANIQVFILLEDFYVYGRKPTAPWGGGGGWV
jgi:hypothetical protein